MKESPFFLRHTWEEIEHRDCPPPIKPKVPDTKGLAATDDGDINSSSSGINQESGGFEDFEAFEAASEATCETALT